MVMYPAPTAFPAPTGVFPPSPAALEPGFGVNPFDPSGSNMYLDNAFSQNTERILGANRAEQQAQLMHAAQLAQVNQTLPGVLEDDPTAWTPETAAMQTDRALAKLSTVNPEAAEKLAAARTGQPDGGGFFDDLKDLAGDILSPALSFGGKVLDIIGRTSYIVPNVVFDAVDGGEFNPLEAVGGALSGEVKHNFNSVFQELGWEGDGFGGFIRATAGLALDIASDPLTWLIPAGAGAKLADTAVMGAKTAATRGLAEKVAGRSVEELTGMGLGQLAETVAGRSADEVEGMLVKHWEEVSQGMAKQGRRLGIKNATAMEEAQWAMVNTAYEAGEAALRKEMWEIGDTTARLLGTRTFRTAARDGLVLSDGVKMTARDVKGLLERAVKTGNGRSVYDEAIAAGKSPQVARDLQKAAWKMGRQYASVGGGFRFKVAIPFTQYRYISSPMASVSRFSPHATGQVFTRFFAGQSGMANLVHEMSLNGAPKTMLRDWMEGGWDNLSRQASADPNVAKALENMRGRGKNLGSMLYSASEKVGGITANFNAGSKAARMGLPAYFAHQAAQEADNAKREFIRSLLKRAGHDDKHLHAELETEMGISMRTGKHNIDPEREWMVAKNLDYFPSDLDYTDPDAVEAWFKAVNPEYEQLLAQDEMVAQGMLGMEQMAGEKLERYQGILRDMQDVGIGGEKGWSARERELLGKLRGRWDVARDEAGKWEARIGNVTMKLDEAMGLHGSQVDAWRAGQGLNHPITQRTYYMSGADASSHRSLLNRGVDSDMATHTEDGVGIRVYSERQSPDDVEVVIRGEDYIELDADHNAQLPAGVVGGSPERTVNDIKVENRRVMEENRPANDWADDVLSPEDMAQREAEMLTAVQRRDRVRARGVHRTREDGVSEVLVWDAENVKRVGDEFTVVGEHQGYMPRQLTDDAKQWVNGEVNPTDPQILLRVPFIRAEIERLTKGMTLDEANDHARAILVAHADEWGVDPASVPARVFVSNLAEADAKYIDALAHDIGAQILGQASQRLNRLGRIAPFMFGKAPRDQLYEWHMSPAWSKTLRQKDHALKSAIARLKKKEAKYLESAHRDYGRQMDDAKEYADLMDEAMSGRPDAIPLPTGTEKWRQQGEAAQAARQRIEQARQFHTARREALSQEQAELARAREQFIQAQEAALNAGPVEPKKQAGQLADEETADLLAAVEETPAAPEAAAPKDDVAAAIAASEAKQANETPVEKYRRIKKQLDYYDEYPAQKANVSNLDEAKAKLDELLADMPETERNLLLAEDAMNAAQAKWNKSQERFDSIDQFKDRAEEERWDKRLLKEEAEYESARQNYADSLREAEAARGAQAAPVSTEGTPFDPYQAKPVKAAQEKAEKANARRSPAARFLSGDSTFEEEEAKLLEQLNSDDLLLRNEEDANPLLTDYVKKQNTSRRAKATKIGKQLDKLRAAKRGERVEFTNAEVRADENFIMARNTLEEELEAARSSADAMAPVETQPVVTPADAADDEALQLHWTTHILGDGRVEVLDAGGNVVAVHDKMSDAVRHIQAQQQGVVAAIDPATIKAARETARVNSVDITDENGIPRRTTLLGEELPAVNLKGADELTGGDYAREDIRYIQTDDVWHNGNPMHIPEDTPGGRHYNQGPVNPETGRTQGLDDLHDQIRDRGYPKPIEVVYYPNGKPAPIGDPLADTVKWEVVDGNHSLTMGHEIGHPYVPVRAVNDETGEVVNLDELFPEHFRSPTKVAEQSFDRQVADGNVFWNRRTGSIIDRNGALLEERRGLAKLRPHEDIQRELDRIAEESFELDRAQRALDEGLEYGAPDAAQSGARRPGETRTPAQRAEFATQQAQRKLAAAAQQAAKKSLEAKDVGRKLERLREQLEEATNAVNRAYAEARGVRAEMKPALVQVKTAGDMKGLMQLRIPGLEGHAMPEYIAEEWHQVLDHRGPGALASGWRQFVLGPWKRWATYRWPGFHVRNFFGAWFNNFLGGVDLHDYSFAWKVNDYGKKDWANTPVSERDFARYGLDKEFGADALGNMTYGHVKTHLAGIGIGSANTRSVLEAADNVGLYQNTVKAITRKDVKGARKLMRTMDERMRGLGAGVEDFHRVAAWGGGMMAMGGDTWGARSFTMMRHGDYAELTNAEDHIRDLIPFYKWMRTNIPYQIRMLAENPGKVTAVTEKAKNWAYDAQGLNRQEAELGMPDYMKETFAVPIPSWVPFVGSKGEDALNHAMMDLPYADLYNGLNDYISAVLPYGRNLLESYGFNKQAFTGKPLEGGKVKLSGFAGNPVFGTLLDKVGLAERGADGSWYIDDRLENVLTAVPIYSKFRNFLEADESRVEARLGGLISTIAGVGVREADATQAELDFYYNEVEPLLQQYRDMGVTFPTTQDFMRGADAVSPTGLADASAVFGEPASGAAKPVAA